MKAAELATLLPDVFRRMLPSDDVLAGALAAMEELHAPVEATLARLDAIFDPRRTPAALVPMLARWVDLERIYASGDDTRGAPLRIEDDIPLGRLRELVANSHRLSQWRGTAAGLIAFLEIATGVAGFAVEEPDASDPAAAFHLRVRVPAAAADRLALVARIVASEKPAYATCELVTI